MKSTPRQPCTILLNMGILYQVVYYVNRLTAEGRLSFQRIRVYSGFKLGFVKVLKSG